MRYFTPELVRQGQLQDPDLLDRHEEEWDSACDAYEASLRTIRENLSPGLARLLDDFYLHDAHIQGMGQQGSLFVLVLQLDTPPRSLLTLQYTLVDPPVIHEDVLSAGLPSVDSSVNWLYDELEQVSDPPFVWRHSILLSNGWEVQLAFRDVQVQEVQTLLPTSRQPSLATA